ncbi:D-alanine--D-alanine ligase [Salimicrobium halophilum]|uniref:D-alanine--D-alanine ligase n=1 Tax=Salimicrobium halophilum TaxID=86666 RepID=A0A1G8UQL3_9BACI|nr:D-alanine--D-alanine ligase [Salimicrobium halophilum]SDJ56078.1 D-alanine--D-alanine ligase [Salimicrobium halophilum]
MSGKKRVGIVFGGKSAEHEVSLQSAKNVVDAIDKDKYDVTLIGIDKAGNWHVNDTGNYLENENDPSNIRLHHSDESVAVVPGREEQQFLQVTEREALEQLDAIFPILHGTLGEDGSIQGMMRIANIPYVGPDILGSAVCMDKDVAKRLLREAGIDVAKSLTVRKRNKDDVTFTKAARTLGTPFFIKPASQGSSVGVSKVNTEEEFDKALDEAFLYDKKVLIEENVEGRELECAVLGNEEPKASHVGEILPAGDFYSYESKYIDESGAGLQLPADLKEEEEERIRKEAVRAFEVLECEGMARVDFFLTNSGKLVINEVNTIPGFTKISMYPKLWDISGLPYPKLIDELIELGIQRHERDSQLKNTVE